MIRTLVGFACLAGAVVLLLRGKRRPVRALRLAMAAALPGFTIVLCVFPVKTPTILVAWHDDELHVLQPLSEIPLRWWFMFTPGKHDWNRFNWHDPWLFVDGCCPKCGKPYAPPNTFVFALLPGGFAVMGREPSRYNHMTTARYVSRWRVLGATTPVALGISGCLAYGPLRRWRRRRKGWCVRCGYDLTGNVTGVCPECGGVA